MRLVDGRINILICNCYFLLRTYKTDICNVDIKITKISGSQRKRNMLQQLIITTISEVYKKQQRVSPIPVLVRNI